MVPLYTAQSGRSGRHSRDSLHSSLFTLLVHLFLWSNISCHDVFVWNFSDEAVPFVFRKAHSSRSQNALARCSTPPHKRVDLVALNSWVLAFSRFKKVFCWVESSVRHGHCLLICLLGEFEASCKSSHVVDYGRVDVNLSVQFALACFKCILLAMDIVFCSRDTTQYPQSARSVFANLSVRAVKQ